MRGTAVTGTREVCVQTPGDSVTGCTVFGFQIPTLRYPVECLRDAPRASCLLPVPTQCSSPPVVSQRPWAQGTGFPLCAENAPSLPPSTLRVWLS